MISVLTQKLHDFFVLYTILYRSFWAIYMSGTGPGGNPENVMISEMGPECAKCIEISILTHK
jgi:hypothetical protein